MDRLKQWILVTILAFVCGFFLGKGRTPQPEVIIKTIQEQIEGDIAIPKPSLEVIPDKPKLPTKLDTVYQIQVVDTAAIITDYILRRDYAFNVFNNDYGKLDITTSLQYNSMTDFKYTYTPITTHEIRTTPTQLFTPFVMAQYNTLNMVSVGGGFFIKNMGGYYNYNISWNQSPSHSIGLIYKFQ